MHGGLPLQNIHDRATVNKLPLWRVAKESGWVVWRRVLRTPTHDRINSFATLTSSVNSFEVRVNRFK